MNILEILQKAVENKLITQEQFEASKVELENKKFTQEDVNKIVVERVTREKEKYETQIEELQKQKENETDEEKAGELEKKVNELTEQINNLTSQLTEKDTEIKNKKIEELIYSKIKEKQLPRELPKPYLSMIKKTDNEEELTSSIEEVINQFKVDFPTEFGGGSNPGGKETNYADMSASDLFTLGLKKK